MEELDTGAGDLEVLMEFAEEDETEGTINEILSTVETLEKKIEAAELHASM